jgi:hypothetical protein
LINAVYAVGVVVAATIKWTSNLRRVWRYQRGNYQNPYIEKEQTTQCTKEKVQKDKQRSTKYIHKSKDQVTGTPLKTGVGAPER